MAYQPIYRRIQADLVSMINDQKYLAGDKIPSETELARKYGVTRMTVRQAVDGLVSDGLLIRRQGSGTYILEQHEARRALNRLTGFTEDLRNQGRASSTIELSHGSMAAPGYVHERLDTEPGAHVVRLERLRLVDGERRHLQIVWLPLSLVPELARVSLAGGSLYEALDQRFGLTLTRARQRISAVAASEPVAQHLQMSPGDPLIHVERLSFDGGNRPIEFVEAWSHPLVPLWIELRR